MRNPAPETQAEDAVSSASAAASTPFSAARSFAAPAVVRPTFRAIFDAELAFVWNSLRRLGVAERDVEDVAHELFVVVNRCLEQYDPNRPIRPWLFAIACRTASDYRRRARNRYEFLAGERGDEAHPGESADHVLQDAQEKNLARRALLAVPEERRQVLILHDFEETAMHDIALGLDIPLKTAYSRLRVAREELIAAARRLQRADREGA
jgi:RNA polymerase sigma-70 factor (ECF subfamily)